MDAHSLSRRSLLLRGASAGLAIAVPAVQAAPSNIATELHSTVNTTQGPFFLDGQLRRADLCTDPFDGSLQPGLPLQLTVDVLALDGATGDTHPMPGVTVDLWQCDAAGRYAGVASEGTAGAQFLRGWQPTDAKGRAQFTTLVPGAYPRRTPHIHCRVRRVGAGDAAEVLTTQFFLDEALLRLVYADAALPYRAHLAGERQHVMTQADDPVFQGSNSCRPGHVAGEGLLLETVRDADQVRARIDLLIDRRQRCHCDEPRFGGGPGMFGGPPHGMPPGPPPGRAWLPGGSPGPRRVRP